MSNQVSGARKTHLEILMATNQKLREERQGMVEKNQANMLELQQKHEEEIKNLAAKAHDEALQLVIQQKFEFMENMIDAEVERERFERELKDSEEVMEDFDEEQAREREAVEQELKDSQDKMKDLNDEQDNNWDTINALIAKDNVQTDEIAGASTMAVKVLEYLSQEENKMLIEQALSKVKRKSTDVQVKSVGSIEHGPWIAAGKRKKLSDATLTRKLSWWEHHIRKMSYNPFNLAESSPGSMNFKRVIDVNDKYLSSLRSFLGDEVYNTVVVALEEMEEYNPSGKYPVPQPWNYSLQMPKKATLGEVIEHLEAVIKGLVLLSTPSRKRRVRPSAQKIIVTEPYSKKS